MKTSRSGQDRTIKLEGVKGNNDDEAANIMESNRILLCLSHNAVAGSVSAEKQVDDVGASFK